MQADPTTRGAPRPQTQPQLAPPPLPPSMAPPALPPEPEPELVDASGLIEVDDADDDVIEVHLDPPRRLWPWALAVVGVALAVGVWRLADAMRERPAGAPTSGASEAVSVAVIDAGAPVAAAPASAPDARVVEAATDALAPAVAADAGPADAGAADAKIQADQAVAAVAPASTAEPDKPRIRRGGDKPNRISPSAALAGGSAPTSAAPVAPATDAPSADDGPRVVARRVTVAGQDVTPKANPTAADRDQARREYLRGTDAQSRGAPKTAQRYFVNALRQGLDGSDASDAQRRLKQLADQIALEASEF